MREYMNMVSHLTCGMSSLHSVNLILFTLQAGSPHPAHITSSHAHTVVWECCKDHRQSQWRMARFNPQPTLNHEPIITKFETRDYVGDIFFQKNFGSVRLGDFVPHIPQIYIQNLRMFTSLFQFFRAPTEKAVWPIFALNTSCAKKCLLRVRKIIFKIWPMYSKNL